MKEPDSHLEVLPTGLREIYEALGPDYNFKGDFFGDIGEMLLCPDVELIAQNIEAEWQNLSNPLKPS